MMKRAITALSVFLLGCQPFGSPLGPVFFADDPSLPEKNEPQAVLWIESEQAAPQISVQHQPSIDRDYTQEFYAWSAESGYPQGQQVYGLLLIYDKNDLTAGLDWLHQSLSQKYAPASIDLAWLFMSGEKVDPNLDLALKYLEVALEAQDKEAFRMAAKISLMKKDTKQAMSYLEQAAALGDLQSQRDLAQFIVEQKRGSWRQAQNLISSLQTESLLEETSELEENWPQNPYHQSSSIPVAPEKSSDLIESHSLLKLPYNPRSYPQSFIEQFESQAEAGSPYAAYQAVLQRLNNPTASSKILCSKSLESLLNEAAQVIVPAQVLKARLILRGYFPQLGPLDAYALLENAAQKGDLYALFATSAWLRQMGQYELSLDAYHKAISQQNYDNALYQFVFDMTEGYYPLQQEQLAIDWLMILAQHAYNPALLLLADLKEKNKVLGTPQEIFMHRYQAAWQGDPQAQYALGNMYLRGDYVAPNPQKAFRWFYQSAYRGYRPAQYQIANHYKNGIGVIPDLPKAYAWRLVAGQGLYEGDEEEMQQLAWSLNQEQLQRALSLSQLYAKYFDQAWVGRRAL